LLILALVAFRRLNQALEALTRLRTSDGTSVRAGTVAGWRGVDLEGSIEIKKLLFFSGMATLAYIWLYLPKFGY
jgi:hypothetical protein